MDIHAQRTTDSEDVGILHDTYGPTMWGKAGLDLSPGSSWANGDRLIGVVVGYVIQVSHVKMQGMRAKGLSSHAVPDAREGDFAVGRACISYGLDDLGDGLWRTDFTDDTALQATGVLKRDREGRRKRQFLPCIFVGKQ